MVKKWQENLTFAEEIDSQSAVVKEFAGEFESFVLSTIDVRSSTYDPSEHK